MFPLEPFKVIQKAAIKLNPPEDNDEFMRKFLPNWDLFQEHLSSIVMQQIEYRFVALYNELTERGHTLLGDDGYAELSDAASEIIIRHWPTDIRLFVQVLPHVPDRFLPHFVLNGLSMCKGTCEILQKTVLTNDREVIGRIESIANGIPLTL